MEAVHNTVHTGPKRVQGLGRQLKGPNSILKINMGHHEVIPWGHNKVQMIQRLEQRVIKKISQFWG